MAKSEKLPTVEELFKKMGCYGFWKPEYATLPIIDVIADLETTPQRMANCGPLRMRLRSLARKREEQAAAGESRATIPIKPTPPVWLDHAGEEKRDDTLNMALSAAGALNVIGHYIEHLGAYGEEQEASKARMVEDVNSVMREMAVFIRLRQKMK